MKKTVLSVLAITLTIGLGAFAQPVMAPTAPWTSPAAARNYALAHCVSGQVSIQSQTMDYSFSGSMTYTNVSGICAEDILAKLAKIDFKFRLLNPEDTITEYLWLVDGEGHTSFFGSVQFTLADIAKNGQPRCEYWQQGLHIFDNVQSAEVIALLPDGSTGNISAVEVDQNGHLVLWPWMLGASNGLLAVRYVDGSVQIYQLNSPVHVSPAQDDTGSSFAMPGHYVFKDPSLISILETYNLPTAFVETTSDNETITLDVGGVYTDPQGNTVVERPYSVEVSSPANGDPTSVKYIDLPAAASTITLPKKATYRMMFHWANFGQNNTLYAGPYNGGGGVGVGVVAGGGSTVGGDNGGVSTPVTGGSNTGGADTPITGGSNTGGIGSPGQ